MRILSSLIILLTLFGCKREGPIAEVKPFLRTVQVIAGDGISITGEFILSGSYRSIEYGFHLDTDIGFKNPIVLPAGTDPEPSKFELNVQMSLKPDVKYYVRAWAKTDKYEVHGNRVEFQTTHVPQPEISKVFPSTGLWGDTIRITGKYFDYFGKGNKVLFNDSACTNIWLKQDTLYAVVPIVKDGSQTIFVNVNGIKSTNGIPFQLAAPVISGILKTEGSYPDTVMISGDNFSIYNTQILFDGKATEMVNVSRKSLSFVVPYIKAEKSVKVELIRFTTSYPVTPNFHYFEQTILPCKPSSAYIGDTIKLYAKNIDFRRIFVDIKNMDAVLIQNYGTNSLIVTHKWKDSLTFVLRGHYQAKSFVIDVQIGKKSLQWPFKEYTKVDQVVVVHASPVIKKLLKSSYTYCETISWTSLGMYFNGAGQGHLIKAVDGRSFSLSSYESSDHWWHSGKLEPGNYSLQIYASGRYSNIEFFTVEAPVIESISPQVFNRDVALQVKGKNLPVITDYQFTHLQSGRSFVVRNLSVATAGNTLQSISNGRIIGSGDYQVEIKTENNTYKYPGTLTCKDFFTYNSRLTDQMGQSSSIGCGFAANGKLYIPQSSDMRIVDLSTGRISVKPGYYNYDHQPVFFENKTYLNIVKNGKYVICSFNEVTEDWDEVSRDGLANDFVMSGFGVFNNHLLAISTSGDIYQFDQKWNWMGNVKLNYYFVHYIHFANGNLYFCDYYMGRIAVVSTSDWKKVREISMPGWYENSLRYIFEKDGEMFFCAKPRGTGDMYYDFYRFTGNETFVSMTPKILYFDFNYHFCPDGKGNVYFVNEGYVYKFNP
jgi:hypothetical protein